MKHLPQRTTPAVVAWAAARGPVFLSQRARALLQRYGLTPRKAMQRVEKLVPTLLEHGCQPTLAVPGRVVDHYTSFIRRLQDAGAEIAVHSYDHINLSACALAVAHRQLARAAHTFQHRGIEAIGFRCPYLGCSEELLETLPPGMFQYSSNMAVHWNVAPAAPSQNTVFDTITRLYRPQPAERVLCVPSIRANLVEIPVSVPDDLQLHDGLQLGPSGVALAWIQMLHQTYERHELLVVLFHPELATRCEESFVATLREAGRLSPQVWVTRLRDVSAWWLEKAGFSAHAAPAGSELSITFDCTDRATILARGIDMTVPCQPWSGRYFRLRHKTLPAPADPRPFIGLAADAPARIAPLLREQGYIIEAGETAPQCGIFLDAGALRNFKSDVELVNWIEAQDTPLVRYGRWPDGAKSALCLSGDLDALSLWDYGPRLFVR